MGGSVLHERKLVILICSSGVNQCVTAPTLRLGSPSLQKKTGDDWRKRVPGLNVLELKLESLGKDHPLHLDSTNQKKQF